MEGAVNEIIVVRAAKGELPRESGLPSVWAARSSSPASGLAVGDCQTVGAVHRASSRGSSTGGRRTASENVRSIWTGHSATRRVRLAVTGVNERVNATGAAHSAAPASYNSRRWRITTWNCPSQKDASETPGLTRGQGEIRERRQTGPHESRHDSFGFGFGLFVGLTETGKVSAGLRGPARGQ